MTSRSEQGSRRGARRMIVGSVFALAAIARVEAGQFPPPPAPTEIVRDESPTTTTERPRVTSQRRSAVTASSSRSVTTPWIPQGPSPTINGQVENILPLNDVTGAIHTVAAHPSDPDVLFVGAINGGIWRTMNATATSPTWEPLTDRLPSLSIGALEFDPADPNRLVAGLGRFSSLSRMGDVLNGLLLTNDGGNTWAEITDPLLVGENISGVAVRGDLLLAASNGDFGVGGLFRTTDGGNSWTRITGTNGLPNEDVFDLVGDPAQPSLFYVAVRRMGIFHSDDDGETWTNVSITDPSLSGIITQAGNNNTEMSVAGNGRLYVAVLVSGRPAYIGFTDDFGASWTAMDLPRTLESNGEVEGLNPGGQGAIHFSIRADQNYPHILYAAGDRQDSPFPNFIGAVNFSGRLFRADTTRLPTGEVPSPQWEHLTHLNTINAIPGGGTGRRSSPHADSREMVVDAAGDLIQVDDGGIYRRTSPLDNTGDWVSLNGNLQTAEFHDIAYDHVSKVIFGGTQDTGTPEQIAPLGTTWRSVSTADGGGVEVDTLSIPGFSIRYSSFQSLGNFRRRVVDANNNVISQAFPPLTVVGGGNPLIPQFYSPLKLNAIVPARLIVGGANGIYESDDFGNTVAAIGPPGVLINDGIGFEAIAYGGRSAGIDNPDVLYIGSGARVFVRVAPSPSPLLITAYAGGTVRDIVLDPDDWLTAYVIDNDDVFMTTDGGGSWIEITGDLSDADLRGIVYVNTASAIIVGGRSGVFHMSTDNPGVWSRFGTGLPEAVVFDLDYDAVDDVLVAGMLGRGAWLVPDVGRSIFPSPTLTVSPTAVAAGDAVTASWNGIPVPVAHDWIGLYQPGVPSSEYIDWIYVSCSQTPESPRTSGSCAFIVPNWLPAGTYELRLLANDGFTELAASNLFAVTAPAPTLTVTPTGVLAGGTVIASWGGIPVPVAFDWIGLYTANATNTEFIDWIYVSCSQTPVFPQESGSCPFIVPDSLTPGTYELRLLANDGFTHLAISNSFAVTSEEQAVP